MTQSYRVLVELRIVGITGTRPGHGRRFRFEDDGEKAGMGELAFLEGAEDQAGAGGGGGAGGEENPGVGAGDEDLGDREVLAAAGGHVGRGGGGVGPGAAGAEAGGQHAAGGGGGGGG